MRNEYVPPQNAANDNLTPEAAAERAAFFRYQRVRLERMVRDTGPTRDCAGDASGRTATTE